MEILLFFINALLLGIIASVVLSYAIAWYENTNSDPSLMEDRFSFRRLWLSARLIGMEVFSLLVSILLRPMGWGAPREKIQPSSHPPVLFLHGLFHNRACWVWLKFRLRRRGFDSLHTLNLSPWRDIEAVTEKVSKRVDELRHALGVEKVHLVGHSMGGIVARNYIQIRGGADKVDRCILLATPNEGSKLAPFAVTGPGKAMMPRSDFLLRLASAPLPSRARLMCIYSRHDNIVLPYQSCRLEEVRNIELPGMGHTSLLYHPRTVTALAAELNGEEHEIGRNFQSSES